ncbi:Probable D,D-dipeptide transport system permease protein ddpC [Tatumella ptyseos]|uniref:Probable D,D-dipeptide transport system permease protein ddpC n=1 Tax=Tatumella ptyseos TaxID=82987 RepID=A0A2X5NUV5_9GAMM|nr:Probable D,D-dipeptide transport system permease protein ddpC [Tatumella ptyseos]
MTELTSRSSATQSRRKIPFLLALGCGLLTLLVLAAIFAPWLAPFDPNAQNMAGRLLPPSELHWLGTDSFGRDLLSRVIYGTRPTLVLIIFILVLTVRSGWRSGWRLAI